MAESKYHTIVIGGGMAGLTCAAYLAKAGRKVLLIEKNKECGGLVSTFSRDGFHFEAGIRALENAGIIFPMLEELGIDLDFVKSYVSVGVEDEILHIKDLSSLEDYRQMLKRIYPESEAEIDSVLKIIRKVMKQMDVLYGVENPNFKDLKKDRSYILKELLPWLPKFVLTIGKINRMQMPVEPYLEKLIINPSLKDIISQHFFKNTPAFFALSYFSLYLDYFYPRGGVGKLAEAVEQKFLDWGGEISRETIIDHVSAHEHRVRDQHKKSYSYDNLVWAADLKTFYRITDTSVLPARVRSRFEKAKTGLLEKRGGDSVYTLYLQLDEPTDSFKKIANGHFFYSPSKQGLGDTHWGGLKQIIESAGDVDKSQILNWLDDYLALNTYEISIPALKDPDMAPAGKTGLIVSILTEYDLFKLVADADWYQEFITEMEDRIIQVLAKSVYPMLKEKIMARFSFSPLSYANRVGSSEGAITGWSFQEAVPVIHKIQQANRAVLTPLPSVYQAGQWTYSPAGVPMSILTGKLAANRVLKN
jgi:phytoene dehydrogenase-like protein